MKNKIGDLKSKGCKGYRENQFTLTPLIHTDPATGERKVMELGG